VRGIGRDREIRTTADLPPIITLWARGTGAWGQDWLPFRREDTSHAVLSPALRLVVQLSRSLPTKRSANMNLTPKGHLRLSCATNRLADGMWGGLPRPEPIVALKQGQQKLSVGFGPWRAKAAERLRAAAVRGELAVYVVAKPQGRSKKCTLTMRPWEEIASVVVPASVLNRLMAPRGGLPDHAYRPSIKTAGGDEGLLALLTTGLLVVRTNDFEAWYRSEQTKGRWPSQRRSRKKSPEGRPTKQTDALRNAVLGLVRDLKWDGKVGIAALHRLLVASGRSEIPSPDTLARLVDQMHRETGEAGLRRIARARRTQG
jgi:hypothetical protein